MVDLNWYASELQHHQITYETCVGGQQYETIFVVTDEAYIRETESFIGYILNEGHDGSIYFSSPLKFVFDGLLYVSKVDEDQVAEVIGKERLELYKRKMDAIVALVNAQVALENQDLLAEEEFEEEGITCPPHEVSDSTHAHEA